MEQQHRGLLRSNYTVLAQELSTAIDDVCAYLYEKTILNESMKQDILPEEAEHLRAMYKSMAQGLQQVTTELQSLKSQQSDLLLEKTQLLDEIAGLQKLRNEDKLELSELRHQQRKAFSEDKANSGMSEMYAAALDKYENMRKDFDVLREQYAELEAFRSTAMSRLNGLLEENASLLSQMEEMRSKNEALSVERNGFKQQCTNAIREWNQAKSTPLNQAYQLLDIVPMRGPRAFDVLYEACKKEQLFKACDKLMPQNAPHEPPEEEEEGELESDFADPTNEEGEDPWTKSSYRTSIWSDGLSCRTVVDRSLYEKHIGNKSFYQMTNKVRGQLLVLTDTDGSMLVSDRCILDYLCRKMNFDGIRLKRIRQKEDLESLQFNPSCDCLMLFIMACGHHGFFNKNGGHGLKLLKETLKNNESLANKPKLVFHMTSTSKKSDEAEGKGKEIDVKNGETVKEEKEDEQNGLTVVPDQNTENPQWPGGDELISSIRNKPSVPPQDNPEDKSLDSPDGPTDDKIPKDSDIIIIQVTDYGCEIVEVWDEELKEKFEITRFLHLIVDVFLKNAYRLHFFDLLVDANNRAERGGGSKVACKATGRRKLYFFPGCQQD